MSEPRRGLEQTGIVLFDDQHVEHMARRAAENGDTKTEALCDAVLGGLCDAEELVDLIEMDESWFDWMLRGRNMGWSTRAG